MGHESVTIEEEELLSFFESEPDRASLDPIWLFDDSIYKAEANGLELTFAIHPSMKDVRLILLSNGHSVYELNATSVQDVRYSSGSGCEALTVVVNEREEIELLVKPNISVRHHYKG